MSGILALFRDTDGTHFEDLVKWKKDEMRAMLEEMQVMRHHWISDMGQSITQLPMNLKTAREELAAKQRTLLTLQKQERHLLTRLMISVNRDHQLANWVRDRQQAETREVRQALGRTLDRALEEREKKRLEQEGQEWIGRQQAWKKGASDWDKWEECERQWEERERQWELDWEEYAQTRCNWLELDPSQQAELAQDQDAEKLKLWERDQIEREREWKEVEGKWKVWRQWEQRWDKDEEERDKVDREQEQKEQEHENQPEESERQWREEQWQWQQQELHWREEQRKGRKQKRQRQEGEQHRWKQQWRRRQGRQSPKQDEKRPQEERRREEQQQWQEEIQRRAEERQHREEERQRREGERQRQKEERERRSRELDRQHQQWLQVQMHWEKRQKVQEQERRERAKQEQLTRESPDLQRSKRRKRLENEQAKAQKWEKKGLELSLSNHQQLAELKELQLLEQESLPLCIVLVQQCEQKLAQLEMEWNVLGQSKVQVEHAQAADAASLELAGCDWLKLVSLAERWLARTSLTSWLPLDEEDLKRRHKHHLLDVMLDNHSAFTIQSPKLDALLVFAGLFSAILSAFLIEIRKGLEEDLLLAILQHLQNTPHPFQPTPVSIWVNGLWFTSLAASLPGTLVVMLAKSRGQWTIGEKEAEALFSTPKGLRRRRDEIRRLHIHIGFKQELALLASTLVYVALILFSSGLSVLLYTTQKSLGISFLAIISSMRLFIFGVLFHNISAFYRK